MDYSAVPVFWIDIPHDYQTGHLYRDQRGPSLAAVDLRPLAQKDLITNRHRHRLAGDDQQEAVHLTAAGLIHVLSLLEIQEGAVNNCPGIGGRAVPVVDGHRLIAEAVIDRASPASECPH